MGGAEVHSIHVQADRLAGPRGILDGFAQHSRPEAAPLLLRKNGNIDDENLGRRFVQPQASHRLSIKQNDEVLRIRILLAVADALGVELHADQARRVARDQVVAARTAARAWRRTVPARTARRRVRQAAVENAERSRALRVDALQRDDEVQRKVGLDVVVWLAAAVYADGRGAHRVVQGSVRINVGAARSRQAVAIRLILGSGRRSGLQSMRVSRYLGLRERDRLRAARLAFIVQAQSVALPLLDRNTTLQVGQREVAPAIAAVDRPEEREQSGVLTKGQQLAIAEGPALGREVAREDSNFT